MNNQRNILFAGAGILVVLVLIAITSGLNSNKPIPKTRVQATDYAQTDASMRLTIEGPINANEKHQSTVITVSRGSRTTAFYRTYNNELIGGQSYENNQAAFEQLVYALERAGFTRQGSSRQDDERGFCPLGQHYIYEIVQSGRSVLRLWSDSCGDREGTFMGNGTLVRQLLRDQIPDFAAQLQNADKAVK